jgi:hypothetical protein
VVSLGEAGPADSLAKISGFEAIIKNKIKKRLTNGKCFEGRAIIFRNTCDFRA